MEGLKMNKKLLEVKTFSALLILLCLCAVSSSSGDKPPVLEARLEKSEITEGETARLVIERAEDPDGGSVKVEYRISGTTWQGVTRGSEELRALSSYSFGKYAIEVRATDEDKRETLKTLNLTILSKTKDYTEDYSGLNMKMMWIEGGSFQMGSPASEKDRDSDEGPVHTVELDGFWLGETEVTVGQFMKFTEDTNYRTDAERGAGPGGKGAYILKSDGTFGWDSSGSWKKPGFSQNNNHPVVCVSWNDAKEYCDWLSGKTGKAYALPTEAQWEYACRAGTRTRFYWGDGDNDLKGKCNLADSTTNFSWKQSWSDGYQYTSPVKSFQGNKFGLFDMHGNVLEWCSDWYGKDYYVKSESKNPKGPSVGDNISYTFDNIKWEGAFGVVRGGSWTTRPMHPAISAPRQAQSLDPVLPPRFPGVPSPSLNVGDLNAWILGNLEKKRGVLGGAPPSSRDFFNKELICENRNANQG